MATHSASGSRHMGRGGGYLAWLVIALFCLFALQFFTYEQRWTSQKSNTVEVEQAFESMLGEYLSFPRNDSAGSENQYLRQMVETLCRERFQDKDIHISKTKASTRDCLAQFWAARAELQHSTKTPPSFSSQQAEHCETMADKKRITALEKEVATLHEIVGSDTTFLDLKGKRVKDETGKSLPWFMSSVGPADNSGLPREFEFPSKQSLGRLLCFMGKDRANGTLNKYGFAWKVHLPPNATLVPGITLIADSFWDYDNIWHAMSSIAPFASWRARNGCAVPHRLLLYHWGEVVPSMSSWAENLVHAYFGRKIEVQTIEQLATGDNPLACFERAVVNRDGLSRYGIKDLFKILRCRTRAYCAVTAPPSVSDARKSAVHVTLFLRKGARAFKNSTAVQGIIQRVCQEHGNCNLEVAHAGSLTFCEQVALMSRTDVLVTPHGAQLTNSMFMPKGSSVMEFMPKGWLDLAGVGQYIYTWLADWSQLNHEGIWRDPEGPECPFPAEATLECFLFYKDLQVGHNETELTAWTRTVLNKFNGTVPLSKLEDGNCTCDHEDGQRGLAPWNKQRVSL